MTISRCGCIRVTMADTIYQKRATTLFLCELQQLESRLLGLGPLRGAMVEMITMLLLARLEPQDRDAVLVTLRECFPSEPVLH